MKKGLKSVFLVFLALCIGSIAYSLVLNLAFKDHFSSNGRLKISTNVFLGMENAICDHSVEGTIRFSVKDRRYNLCSKNKWLEVDSCVTSPGSICRDSTHFVGFSPQDGLPLFMGERTQAETWNNGSTDGYSSTQAISLQDGQLNTKKLVESKDNGAPYKAAQYCHDLVEFGYKDWYLPARDELAIVEAVQIAVASETTQQTVGAYIWSSTEAAKEAAWFHHGQTLGKDTSGKDRKFKIICVRKQPPVE